MRIFGRPLPTGVVIFPAEAAFCAVDHAVANQMRDRLHVDAGIMLFHAQFGLVERCICSRRSLPVLLLAFDPPAKSDGIGFGHLALFPDDRKLNAFNHAQCCDPFRVAGSQPESELPAEGMAYQANVGET